MSGKSRVSFQLNLNCLCCRFVCWASANRPTSGRESWERVTNIRATIRRAASVFREDLHLLEPVCGRSRCCPSRCERHHQAALVRDGHATLTFTPNLRGRRAMPLLMHSTSGMPGHSACACSWGTDADVPGSARQLAQHNAELVGVCFKQDRLTTR
jgi:hypothetical protein